MYDSCYEWKAVTLMSLGMGLVGADRFLIVPATILFSMLTGVTGLALGVGSLIAIRVALGLAEGAFVPASIIATIDASNPSRRGFNVGIQQAMPALLGLGLTPLAVTQLLRIMNWRWIFLFVAIPGLIVSWLGAKVLRKPSAQRLTTHSIVHDVEGYGWHHVLRYRNVPLAVLLMLCWLSCNIVIAALFPSYLVDHLGLGLQQTGLVLSSLGFGGAIGSLALPLLSDRIGRKPLMLILVVGALAALIALTDIGPNVPMLLDQSKRRWRQLYQRRLARVFWHGSQCVGWARAKRSHHSLISSLPKGAVLLPAR